MLFLYRLEENNEELPSNIKNDTKNDLKKDKLFFKCCSDTCEKTFSVAHTLKLHIMSVHEGISKKRDMCHFCGKSINYLQKHLDNFHNGSTKKECYLCDQPFEGKTFFLISRVFFF